MAISVDSKCILLAALALLAAAQVSTQGTEKNAGFGSKLYEVGRGSDNVKYRRLVEAPTIECGGACEERCKLNGRHGLCMRACGTCCMRCNCVPPGQSGNRELCGSCYTDMKTHRNQTKCP